MPASKNLLKRSETPVNNYSRGQQAESVAADYFKSKGFVVLLRNISFYYAEVDLLMLSPQGEIVLIEVKSIKDEMVWRRPVSTNQKKRLKRTFESVLSSAHKTKSIVRFHLATVNTENEVSIFEDFLSD